jgi:hypothetical protein
MSARRPTERLDEPRLMVATTPWPPILAELGQFGANEAGGRGLAQGKLRVGVQMMPPALQGSRKVEWHGTDLKK